MQTMSNLDYGFIARELDAALVGAFLNKVYELRPGVLRFKFHKKGEINLLVELGWGAYLASKLEEPPDSPSHFATLLRRKLANAIVKGVKQLNFDRVMSIAFSTAGGEYSLVFEMLGKGNALLCSGTGSILGVYRVEQFAARSLKIGQEYVLPPSGKKNPSDIDGTDLAGLDGKIIPALSKKINLSPFYLEEACLRAGISFDSKKLSQPEVRKLESELKALNEPFFSVYYDEGKPIAFASILLQKMRLQNAEVKELSSFSEALEEYFSKVSRVRKTSRKDAEIAGLKKALEQQARVLEDGKAEEAKLRETAAVMEASLVQVQALLDSFAQMKQRKKTDAEIARELGLEIIKGRIVTEIQ